MDSSSKEKIETKIETYKEIFQGDPLYQQLIRMELLDKLFEPCLLFERVLMDSNHTYSTKQASELLEISGKEQTLINFLNRNDFNDYIKIYRTAGNRSFYRYDYITLFQFKMLLLLTTYDLTPSDIANIIGTKVEFTYSDNKLSKFKNTPAVGNQEVESIVTEKVTEMMTTFVQHFKQREAITNQRTLLYDERVSLEHKLVLWESDMRALVGRIEDIELYKGLFNNVFIKSTEKEEPGFWQRIFNSKSSTTSGIEINPEIDKKFIMLQERYDKLLENKKQMEQQKEIIIKELEAVKTKLKLETSNSQGGQLPIREEDEDNNSR